MPLAKKILTIWCSIFALSLDSLLIFNHRSTEMMEQANQGLLLLLAVLSFFLFRSDPNRTNKPVFFNFLILFGSALLIHVYLFLGYSLLPKIPFLDFYFYQYVQLGLFYFLLSFSVLYIVFDSLFHDFRIYQKYILTFLVVAGVFGYYYHPILENPNYLYTTPDIVDFKAIKNSVTSLQSSGNVRPTIDQIASRTTLHAWKDDKQVGTLFDDQKLLRIQELLPYLDGTNYTRLVWRPIYFRVIYMNVLTLVFIFLYFGYQYKKDPPQGAYIEKIVFLFLPFCSIEILHSYAFAQAVEVDSYLQIYEIGKYLTILITILLVVFFSLRLRFITSVKGEFYEQELVSDSEHISRWRDGIDNLIVRHFLNPQTFHGRLLAPRAPRSKT